MTSGLINMATRSLLTALLLGKSPRRILLLQLVPATSYFFAGICSTASASLLNCNCEPGPPGPPGPRGPPGAGFGFGGGGGGAGGNGIGGNGIGGFGGGWGYGPVPPFNPHLGPIIGPRGLPGPPGPPGYCFPCPYGGAGVGPNGFGLDNFGPNGFASNGQGTLGQGIASAIGNIIIIPSGINGRAQLFRITPDGQLLRIENPRESINEILPSTVQDLLAQQSAQAAAVPTAASNTGITPPHSRPAPTQSTQQDDQTDGLDETMFAVPSANPERKDSPLRASSDANDWRRVLLLGEPNVASAAASSEQGSTSPLENSMDSFQRALVDLRDKYASLMQPRTTPDQRYAVIL